MRIIPTVFGCDTEDCISLKHKFQDLVHQNVVKTVAPNVYSNLQLNYGGTNIIMIEMEDELCMVKEIVLTGADNLEKVVASSNMSDKINFTSMTHHKAFAFVSREDQHNNEINHVPPKYLPHLG